MERSVVNPWQCSVAMGFNQGELVRGETQTLYYAGQTAVDGNGAPHHVGDTASQLALAIACHPDLRPATPFQHA